MEEDNKAELFLSNIIFVTKNDAFLFYDGLHGKPLEHIPSFGNDNDENITCRISKDNGKNLTFNINEFITQDNNNNIKKEIITTDGIDIF